MAELIVPKVDFSPLGNLGKLYKESMNEQGLKDAFSQGIGSDPQSLAALAQKVAPYNPQLGINLAQLAHGYQRQGTQDARQQSLDQFNQNMRQKEYDLSVRRANRADDPTPENWQRSADGKLEPIPGGPADPAYIERLQGIKKQGEISPTDKKMITAAEDELPNLDGTIDVLKTAKGLNDKTFTGYTAGARGMIGTSGVPGANLLIDKNSAMATREFQQLMSGEAIKTMSDTLKGATTDFEMKKFENMMADPSTPPEIRGRMIDRMLKLAEKHRDTKVRRMDDLRGRTYFKPSSETGPTGPTRQLAQEPAAQPAPQDAQGFRQPPRVGELRDGYRYKGGNPGDPANWVKQQNFDDRFSAAYSGSR